MDPKRVALRDKILGTLFGAAIGDALGISTEFLKKDQAEAVYRHNLELHKGKFSFTGWGGRDAEGNTNDNKKDKALHHNLWKEGDWSDDTD